MWRKTKHRQCPPLFKVYFRLTSDKGLCSPVMGKKKGGGMVPLNKESIFYQAVVFPPPLCIRMWLLTLTAANVDLPTKGKVETSSVTSDRYYILHINLWQRKVRDDVREVSGCQALLYKCPRTRNIPWPCSVVPPRNTWHFDQSLPEFFLKKSSHLTGVLYKALWRWLKWLGRNI